MPKPTAAQKEAFDLWGTLLSAQVGRDISLDNDYDMLGLFLSGAAPAAAASGHFPDAFKLPNHPTFSQESSRSAPNASPTGGMWGQDERGQPWFIPGSTEWSPAQLRRYFKKVEPETELLY